VRAALDLDVTRVVKYAAYLSGLRPARARHASRPCMPLSLPWAAPPVVQEHDEFGAVVVGAGWLQSGHEPVDRDVAGTQLVGEVGCDGVAAGDVDDRAAMTELARGLLIDHGGGAHRGVHDDVDTAERGLRLVEESLDVQLVGDVGAYGERRSVRGDNFLDRGLGFTLVAQVDDHYGVALAPEFPRDVAAGPARAAGDDRHWVDS
jgi:hypothetical protein